MNRKAYVDFVKCIAIFFVLFNHIGLTIPYVSSFGGMFYVPVFFVLAGYTYHRKEESYSDFVKRKARRLLIPYGIANVIYFVFFFFKDWVLQGTVGIQSFTPLLGILYSRYSLYPPIEVFEKKNLFFLTIQNSPTWFLTALFLTYLLFEIAVRIGEKWREKQAETLSLAISGGVCLLLGVVLHYVCPILLPWSLECVPLFMIYMLAGYFVAKGNFLERIWEKKGLFPCFVLAFLVAVTAVGYWLCGSANISVGCFGDYTALGVLNGISSSLLLIFVCCRLEKLLPRMLCGVGKNTLHILCYHLFLFMFLITGCNLLFPGVLQGENGMAYLLKFLIVVFTVLLIMVADWSIRQVLQKRGISV